MIVFVIYGILMMFLFFIFTIAWLNSNITTMQYKLGLKALLIMTVIVNVVGSIIVIYI